MENFLCNILRSVQGVKQANALFNLEGTGKNVPYMKKWKHCGICFDDGPIAQLARAHD